jgi:hypothetical protein
MCHERATEAATPTRTPVRELAERTSNGTLVRLLWLQGTSELWVEVSEPELDVTSVIPAEPERALDAFYHPYASSGNRLRSRATPELSRRPRKTGG